MGRGGRSPWGRPDSLHSPLVAFRQLLHTPLARQSAA